MSAKSFKTTEYPSFKLTVRENLRVKYISILIDGCLKMSPFKKNFFFAAADYILKPVLAYTGQLIGQAVTR